MWSVLLSVLGIVVVVGLVLLVFLRDKKAWNATLKQLEAKTSLNLIGEDDLFRRGKLVGRTDDLRVEVDCFSDNQGDSSTHYHRARAWVDVSSSLRITPESFGTGFVKMLGGQDHEVGDPQFDPMVRIRGDASEAQAHLSAEARQAIADAMHFHCTVRDGYAAVYAEGTKPSIGELERVLELAIAIGKGMSMEGRLTDRLRVRALEDPLALVRARALRHLHELQPAESYPVAAEVLEAAGLAATVDAATSALSRRDVDLVLAAAVRLSVDGDTSAVPLLRAAAEGVPSDIAQQLERAVAEIQSRVSHAAGGGVTLASGAQSGGLSEAAKQGALSATRNREGA
jgi:hypothetical protein